MESYDPADKTWNENTYWLRRLILGTASIVRLPWKPKYGDEYFAVSTSDPSLQPGVVRHEWYRDIYDYTLYRIGNCFKTKKEAERNKERIINELISYYENGGEEK